MIRRQPADAAGKRRGILPALSPQSTRHATKSTWKANLRGGCRRPGIGAGADARRPSGLATRLLLDGFGSAAWRRNWSGSAWCRVNSSSYRPSAAACVAIGCGDAPQAGRRRCPDRLCRRHQRRRRPARPNLAASARTMRRVQGRWWRHPQAARRFALAGMEPDGPETGEDAGSGPTPALSASRRRSFLVRDNLAPAAASNVLI